MKIRRQEFRLKKYDVDYDALVYRPKKPYSCEFRSLHICTSNYRKTKELWEYWWVIPISFKVFDEIRLQCKEDELFLGGFRYGLDGGSCTFFTAAIKPKYNHNIEEENK
jgi:hypothetical protein